MLSFADCLSNLSYFLGNPSSPSGLCDFQAILQQFGSTYSYCWVVAISHHLYRMFLPDPDAPKTYLDLTEDERTVVDERTFRDYNFVIFGYTAFMTVVPFFGDTYGDSGAWCWIDNSDAGKAWRFLAFYVPVWCALIWMAWMYWEIYDKKLRDKIEGLD